MKKEFSAESQVQVKPVFTITFTWKEHSKKASKPVSQWLTGFECLLHWQIWTISWKFNVRKKLKHPKGSLFPKGKWIKYRLLFKKLGLKFIKIKVNKTHIKIVKMRVVHECFALIAPTN